MVTNCIGSGILTSLAIPSSSPTAAVYMYMEHVRHEGIEYMYMYMEHVRHEGIEYMYM